MKKALAFLLAMTLLLTIALPAAAEEGTVIAPEVQNSITEEEETGVGLAFRFTVAATGVEAGVKNDFVNTNATVIHNGVAAPLVKMGAIVTNDDSIGEDAATMTLDAVNGKKVINIEGQKLNQVEETYCSFAVRIIKLPASALKETIYARPYYVVEVEGVEVTVYGAISNRSHFSVWCDNNPVELPAIGTDIDVVKKRDRIRVSAATIEDRTVILTFRNYSANWITEENDYVKYTCYDGDGNALENGTIYIGCIDTKKNKEKSFSFVVPDATAKVALTGSKIVYWTEWA